MFCPPQAAGQGSVCCLFFAPAFLRRSPSVMLSFLVCMSIWLLRCSVQWDHLVPVLFLFFLFCFLFFSFFLRPPLFLPCWGHIQVLFFFWWGSVYHQIALGCCFSGFFFLRLFVLVDLCALRRKPCEPRLEFVERACGVQTKRCLQILCLQMLRSSCARPCVPSRTNEVVFPWFPWFDAGLKILGDF
ncbi:unnamed protein product, partial [Ectocarpus sp. 6 AP-2014]